MSTLMIQPAAAREANGSSDSVSPQPAKPKESADGGIASKEVFLQLLVAQIRHQNPLNPADGTEFVAQLAQFSQLEATLAMRKDLEKIREVLAPSDPEEGGDAGRTIQQKDPS